MSSRSHHPQSTPRGENSTMLVVRLSPGLKRAIESDAAGRGCSTSDLVRFVLRTHVTKESQ
jgi:hypothetical protein